MRSLFAAIIVLGRSFDHHLAILSVVITGATLGFLSVSLELSILGILCVVFLLAAHFLLAHIERIAIQEGRITESKR